MSKKTTLSTMCACAGEENDIWVFSNDFNGMLKIELEDMSLKYITSFEKEEMTLSYAYSKAIWYEKKIYLFPLLANAIAIYDTIKNSVSYIEIMEDRIEKNFNVVQISKREVLLFPVFYSNKAYVFDLELNTYKVLYLNYGASKDIVSDAMVQGNAFYNGKAYFAVVNKPYILCLSLADGMCRVLNSHNEQGVFNIASFRNQLIVLAADGCSYDVYVDEHFLRRHIFKGNKDSKHKQGSPVDMKYIQNIVRSNGSILSVPVCGDDVNICEDENEEYIPLEWEKVVETRKRVQAFAICIEKNSIAYFLPYEGKALVVFDLLSKRAEYYTMEIAKEDRSRIYSKVLQSQEPVFEKEWISIEELLKNVIQDKH